MASSKQASALYLARSRSHPSQAQRTRQNGTKHSKWLSTIYAMRQHRLASAGLSLNVFDFSNQSAPATTTHWPSDLPNAPPHPTSSNKYRPKMIVLFAGPLFIPAQLSDVCCGAIFRSWLCEQVEALTNSGQQTSCNDKSLDHKSRFAATLRFNSFMSRRPHKLWERDSRKNLNFNTFSQTYT